MYGFTWKVFSETGNIETYLLLKEMEKEEHRMRKDADSIHSVSTIVNTKRKSNN